MRKTLLVVLVVLLGVITTTSCAQSTTPKVTLSTTKIQIPGHVYDQGSGFTPKRNISSHLQKPDGKEYQVLPLITDDRGEFKHDIETLVLSIGVHELWVVDDTTKVSSNRVKFEVIN